MTEQVIKVRRSILQQCFTCPICTDLLQDATKINECLHTFCRKCIYEKLKDVQGIYCPVCNIWLGRHRVQKLRADHNFQDIKDIIFRSNSKIADAASNSHIPDRRPEYGDGLQEEKEAVGAPISEAHIPPGNEGKKHGEVSVLNDSNDTNRVSSRRVKRTKINRMRRKRVASSKDQDISNQAVPDGTSIQRNKGNYPIWFTLKAFQDQEGYGTLPQIPVGYLAIKDGSMQVLSIQKYLMVKLNLTSASEVEIKCEGEKISPKSEVKDLLYWWLHRVSSSDRVKANVGESAEKFVMKLHYGRNIQQP